MNQAPKNTALKNQKASIFGKIGIGLQSSLLNPFDFTVEYDGSYNDLASGLNEYFLNNLSCTEISSENVGYDINLEIIEQNHATSAEEEENDIYFYHTDHLGSSSWITYTDGSVTQHMQNLPFGEPFIDQRTTEYDIRYKFTGKEMDTETGYQYFGARYYNSDISVWLSVDPLADKYPSMSSYMYTAGNPVMLVDPDGRWSMKFWARYKRNRAINKFGANMVSPLRKINGEWGFHIREIPEVTPSRSYDVGDSGPIDVEINLSGVEVEAFAGYFVSNNKQTRAIFGIWDIKKGNHSIKAKSRKITSLERFMYNNFDQSEIERIFKIFAGSNDDEGFNHTVYEVFDEIVGVQGKNRSTSKNEPGNSLETIKNNSKWDSIKVWSNGKDGSKDTTFWKNGYQKGYYDHPQKSNQEKVESL